MAYQLGGFEGVTADALSINMMQDYTTIPDMVHYGSIHPFDNNCHNVDYSNADDLHHTAILHFSNKQVWGDDDKAFPMAEFYDRTYNDLDNAGDPAQAPPSNGPPTFDISESSSSKDVRADGATQEQGNSVIFQIYIAEKDPNQLQLNMEPLRKLRAKARTELMTNDQKDWATYKVKFPSLEKANSFIEYYNSLERNGVYCAMLAQHFYTDWHAPNDKHTGALGNVVFARGRLNQAPS